jgi:hypothetical protein
VENMVESDRRQMTIYDTCAFHAATDTRSEYVIIIVFPRPKWLCERASMLRYTYITWLVCFSSVVGYDYVSLELRPLTDDR